MTGPLAALGAPGLAGEQAQDAIGVAHRGNFRIDHHHGMVGEIHRQVRTFLDAGRRVAHDVVEAVFGKAVEHLLDAFLGQCILVAGLAGGQHVQVVVALVLDQRLLQRGFAVDDVDEVVHHAPLATHDQVEVAQADVEVDDRDFLAGHGQAGGKRGAGRRLADAAFAGGDNDNLSSQGPISAMFLFFVVGDHSLAINSFSPSSQHCTDWPSRSSGICSKTR